jgi:cytochrome c oxidase subunit 2
LLAALLLLPGCSFWLDGPQSTIQVDGPVARAQRDLFFTTCYVTLGIFLAVGVSLGYATLRFRARRGASKAVHEGPAGHGNPLVEGGLILASLVALVFIAVPTVRTIWYTHEVPWESQDQALVVDATGYQWWWKFEYPSGPVPLLGGGSGPVSAANELVIPAGRPVHINLRTADVIHSFWVPKLAGKVDMMPNRANHLWLQADQPGYFYGQCAQYCGDSHAVMRFRVVALPQAEFDAWLKGQQANAASPAAATVAGTGAVPFVLPAHARNEYGFSPRWNEGSPASLLELWRGQQQAHPAADPRVVEHGRKLFQDKSCIACHTVRGHDGSGVIGPDLTHVASRSTLAGGLLENTPDQLARWIRHPDEVKPGNRMYAAGYIPYKITLAEDEVSALVAYLESLR